MTELDADLHLHSHYSGGVSDRMVVPELARQASRKGLDLIGTGDILHPQWRQHVKDNVESGGNGLYRLNQVKFLLTAEVEDSNRVHHLLLFPSWAQVQAVYHDLEPASNNLDREGRPRVELDGQELAHICDRHEVVFGPAHAFTPWTAVYKEYDTLKECYGSYRDKVNFLELGLSADTALADTISDHHDLVYLSNSDAHSPWPHRLGREFNRLQLVKPDFNHIQRALANKGNNAVTLNVGLDPRQGKYHCTACADCYTHFSLPEARGFSFGCPECGGSIKKGVKDRIKQLSDTKKSPSWRPEYIHLPPLASLIQTIIGHSSPTTNQVQRIWNNYLDRYESEIEVLVEAPISELKSVQREIGQAIDMFRQGEVSIQPGGGGEYGHWELDRSSHSSEAEGYTNNSDQTSLNHFS